MSFWKTVLLGNTYNATRKILKAREQNPDVRVPLILKNNRNRTCRINYLLAVAMTGSMSDMVIPKP